MNPNNQDIPSVRAIHKFAGPIEPWNQGAANPSGISLRGDSGKSSESPLRRLHKLLRGRYLLAIGLAIGFGVVGAAGGFFSQKPNYKSDGLIEIKPIVPDIDSYDRVMLMYNTHMQSQVAWLKSERLIKEALKRPEWTQVSPNMGPDMAGAFNANLVVTYLKNTPLLQVTYTDPNAEVAPAAVKAVISTYRDRFSGEHLRTTNRKIEHWESTKDECVRGIDANKKIIEELSGPYGYDDLTLLLNSQLQEQIHLDSLVRDADMAVVSAQTNKSPDMSAEDISRIDPIMARHLTARNDMEVQLEQTRFQLGAEHPLVKRIQNQLDIRDKIVQKYAAEFSAKYSGQRLNADGTPAGLMPRDPTILKAQADRLREFAASERKKTNTLGQTHRRITNAKTETAELNTKLKEADEQLEKLNFQKSLIGELNIISDGNAATVDTDKRAKFAAVGLLGGGALPVCFLLLIGLLDHRYRFSDEATNSHELAGIRLLGILPNLPDRLSDPEQAAIAAHCVHQIRTMLQIDGAPNPSRVFAVTSATPGDGKTSLTLALGLSYAACGTRTLLIDCDLVGAGLTHRMNVNAEEGVLEAISQRSLMAYVRKTDIPDVTILPVGAAQAHHASTLSPAALRRLIEEAEQHFDVVLIDTGPLLGSIEAPQVCSSADGVILAVARGQQRPLVQKCTNQLNGIGAKLAGVVFNRAEAGDFERSVSGMSLRSFSSRRSGRNGPGSDPSRSRYGPVARAVVRSSTSEDDNAGGSSELG